MNNNINNELSNQLLETTKNGNLISKWNLKKIQRKIKKANKEPFDWELFWVSTGIITAILGSLAFWGGLITLIVLLCIRIL